MIRYELRDASGRWVATHRREDHPAGKRLWWELPDHTPGLGGLRLVDLPLYGIDRLTKASTVVVVEGEKAAEALRSIGVQAVGTVTGASGSPSDTVLDELTGRCTLLWPDHDAVGRAHMDRIAERLRGIAASVGILDWPAAPEGGDAADFVLSGKGHGDVLALPTHRVAERRAGPAIAGMTLAATLDILVAHLRRFVHFSAAEHADAVALWVAHSHLSLDRLDQSPILALTSAVKQSGKTRVLEVIEPIVRDGWRIARPSEAVLFRKIDADHPTVLLDEVDTIFNDRAGATEGIRAIFNSGNRRGTRVPRLMPQGRSFTLVEFDIFCPKVTAGIGGLPDTVLDRAIVIPMERQARHERLERLRGLRASELGEPLRDTLADLVSRIDRVTVADNALPSELDDRAQDGWEPLIAIADAAGADWPGRARAAAIRIFAGRVVAEDNHELRLLHDSRAVFNDFTGPFLPTAVLRERLAALEDAPWNDIRGKPVTARYIGLLLGKFEIRPIRQRMAGESNPIHGYLRTDFVGPWERYARSPAIGTSGTSGTRGGAPPADVPSVPAVPLPVARGGGTAEAMRTAWQPVGDDDWVMGTA